VTCICWSAVTVTVFAVITPPPSIAAVVPLATVPLSVVVFAGLDGAAVEAVERAEFAISFWPAMNSWDPLAPAVSSVMASPAMASL
jgi:hypothetical protein